MAALIERLRRGGDLCHSFCLNCPTTLSSKLIIRPHPDPHPRPCLSQSHSLSLSSTQPTLSLLRPPSPGVAASPSPTWRPRATPMRRSTSCRWPRPADDLSSMGHSTSWTENGTMQPWTSRLGALWVQSFLGSPPPLSLPPSQGDSRLDTAPLIQGAPTSS